MTEAQFQVQVIDLAKMAGWLVHAERPAQYRDGRWATHIQGHAGYLDLTLVHAQRKRVVFSELKVGRNKLTSEQERWLQAFRLCGAEAYVWTPADQAAIIALLTGA